MHHPFRFAPARSRLCFVLQQILRSLVIGLSILSPEICLAQPGTDTKEKKQGAMIRMLCVQSLSKEQEEVALATKTEDEKWIELGAVTLRSPFISEWVRVPHGTTYLITKKSEKSIPLGSFLVPQDSQRSIVILFPDSSKNTYRTQVIEPNKLDFQKGEVLILNYGTVPAVVVMGKTKLTVNPGQKVVEKIIAEQEGMYRLLIGHLDKNQKIIACHDRYVSSNPETRKFILLFPDQDTGLRAMSLSEFGPFE